MKSPTSASALLHSFTIVCIPWLLFLKWHWSLNLNILFYFLIFFSLFSFSLYDFKQWLALSTSNNISLLFLNKSSISFIHFLNHGLFKSFLFVFAGFLFHSLSSFDYRFLSGSFFHNPLFFKILLFLLTPFPFSFLANSKEFLFLNSPSIFFFFYSFFYIAAILFFSHLFLNSPSWSFYFSRDFSLFPKFLILFFILFFIISSNFNLFFNSFISSYFDFFPFLWFSFFSFFSFNFFFHFELLLSKFLLSLID